MTAVLWETMQPSFHNELRNGTITAPNGSEMATIVNVWTLTTVFSFLYSFTAYEVQN